MGEFKRNPSKVWWASDAMEYRDSTASPGSQDSGFSDTENSPNQQNTVKHQSKTNTPKTVPSENSPLRVTPKDIFKDSSSTEQSQNLSSNYKEKCTPKKSIANNLCKERKIQSEPRGNSNQQDDLDQTRRSEPSGYRHRYTKHSPKVSRNLFNSRRKESSKDAIAANQYSKDAIQDTTHSTISSYEHSSDSHSWLSNGEDSSYERPLLTQTVPLLNSGSKQSFLSNQTAPAVLQNSRGNSYNSCGNSTSSDCDSELECLFNAHLSSPRLTSTPKGALLDSMRHRRRKLSQRVIINSYNQERVAPVLTEGEVDNEAVKRWLEEVRQHYEQECMTTFQSKSIMGELNQKISHIASRITLRIRDIISHARCIEEEYQTLNSETRHIGPLAQSLAGNIIEYIKTYTKEMASNMDRQYDEIRKGTEDSLNILNSLLTTWQVIHYDTLAKEVGKLVDRLDDPCSELDLRASVMGITSLALRNEELINMFIKADIISILIILCEKCEGPSIRSSLLRALSTMCCSAVAVRQLEKFSGIQIIADTIEDETRPEPERSEAIALLAQITAPWIEDNYSIRGLQEHSKKLVKSLTKFISSTKCCQNLLLCVAALANLTAMDSKCIRYLLQQKTIKVALEVLKKRGPLVSIYLLEQVATLLANMSAIEDARQQLTNIEAPAALLDFLQRSSANEAVEKRLQQKAIIALSRLSKVKEAAEQIVHLGGVQILVRLCKEKDVRHDSDAVLVASLATLRKIADVCGSNVVSAQDAQELVEPKLLDSFLAYSTQNESYV